MQIRPAHLDEHRLLSRIALSSKSHWGYAEEDLRRWADELTLNRESIAAAVTFVAELPTGVAGFYQLAPIKDGVELEHFWVHPDSMGQGVGRGLLHHACEQAQRLGYACLRIDADPHAEPFYLACGARRVSEIAAPLPGDPERVRPLLELACAAPGLRHPPGEGPPRN